MEPAATSGIVVPCFDEAQRLRPDGLLALLERDGLHVYLVDDGSTDGTGALLAAMRERCPSRVDVITLERNGGKGEAVRAGLRRALADGHALVGYFDADLATSVADLHHLLDVADAEPDLQVVMAARVKMLGHDVERTVYRHYSGRVFATAASMVLGFAVYDTQCGAKVLRGGPRLDAALSRAFSSRWAFDVELLGRLTRGSATTPAVTLAELREVPVSAWHHIDGSSLSLTGSLRAAAQLATIRRRLSSWR